MKRSYITLIIIAVVVVIAVGLLIYQQTGFIPAEDREPLVVDPGADPEEVEPGDDDPKEEEDHFPDGPDQQIIIENLSIPWELAFLPEGGMLITERRGVLLYITEDGVVNTIEIESPEHVGEGGLLGMALHPSFEENRFLYIYFTTGVGNGLINRVERHRFEDGGLVDRLTIIDEIPGAQIHDGGRIAFGPDGMLYITTGDAAVPSLAQDRDSLAGKILRLEEDGSVPGDNPFGTPVYSYGHRNPQGLAWDSAGNLWATEHGPSAQDELNLIESGNNYGWPEIEGDQSAPGMEDPAIHSGTGETWAPSGAVYYDGSIFFTGLRGATLYEAVISGNEVTELRRHLEGEYGRLRTIVAGPDGYFYLLTNNLDGRGIPQSGDDRIIRINPQMFRE
jgi:glucose/arabinose dehydrogenase